VELVNVLGVVIEFTQTSLDLAEAGSGVSKPKVSTRANIAENDLVEFCLFIRPM
jgi:hypothetical protein